MKVLSQNMKLKLNKLKVSGYLVILCMTISCRSSRKLAKETPGLNSLMESSAIFNNHFTGFALYDPVTTQYLFKQNANKYFTPASNTKILTLYSALTFLPDTLPSFKYFETDRDIYIKGMGDPTFLHPLWIDHPGFQKLLQTEKRIHFVYDQYMDAAFGPGWAWNDYQDDYQAEISDFPLYGNLVEFVYDTVKNTVQTYPDYFSNRWFWQMKHDERKVSRSIDNNEFYVDTSFKDSLQLPFKADHVTLMKMLADTLRKQIDMISLKDLPIDIQWSIQKSVAADSVYAQMMKVSDNFIAEQLILQIGSYTSDSCHTTATLKKIKSSLFPDTLQSFQWEDGSGLSRYNLFSFDQIIFALNKILSMKGIEWITKIFPAGGQSGTIKNWYKSSEPYIYAKTGSLSNNRALSGYIHTKKDHWLIFSFLHSNFVGSSMPIVIEMQKTLEFIRDNY